MARHTERTLRTKIHFVLGNGGFGGLDVSPSPSCGFVSLFKEKGVDRSVVSGKCVYGGVGQAPPELWLSQLRQSNGVNLPTASGKHIRSTLKTI